MKNKYTLLEKRKRYLELAEEAERQGAWKQVAAYLRKAVALGMQLLEEEE